MKAKVPQQKSTVFRSIKSSAFLGVAGLLLGLLLIPLVLSEIGAANYGVWLIVSTLTTYLFQADLGMGSALVRYGAIASARSDRRSLSELFVNSFVWMTGVGLLLGPLVGLACWLLITNSASVLVVGSNSAVVMSLLSALLVSLLGLRSFPALLQAVGLWSLERYYQFAGVIIRCVGTMICCIWFPTVLSVALVEVIALLLPALLSLVSVRRRRLVDVPFGAISVTRIKELLSFSVRIFAVGAIGTAIIQIGVVVAGLTVSPAIAAYYNAILKVYLAVRQALTWVGEPFLPALSKIQDEHEDRRRTRVLSVVFISIIVGTSGCIALALSAPELLHLWLPEVPDDLNLSLCLQVLLAGMAINCFHIGAISAMNAIGLPGAFLKLQTIWLVSTALLCLSLGNTFGLIGISLGNALPIILLEPLYIRRYLRVFEISWSTWFARCFVPALISCSCGMAFVAGLYVVLHVRHWSASGFILSAVFLSGTLLLLWRSRNSVVVMNVKHTLKISA